MKTNCTEAEKEPHKGKSTKITDPHSKAMKAIILDCDVIAELQISKEQKKGKCTRPGAFFVYLKQRRFLQSSEETAQSHKLTGLIAVLRFNPC